MTMAALLPIAKSGKDKIISTAIDAANTQVIGWGETKPLKSGGVRTYNFSVKAWEVGAVALGAIAAYEMINWINAAKNGSGQIPSQPPWWLWIASPTAAGTWAVSGAAGSTLSQATGGSTPWWLWAASPTVAGTETGYNWLKSLL